ncbi:MAG: membrane protein insertion efficiency factor YidD [Nitrospirae bacterium]|nr:membrane protein insertion efficiency factor YidD [Nitrospirota bacterium]
MKALAIIIVKGYKSYISPFLPNTCRFYPTCSSYSLDALEQYGFLKGLWLTLKRIAKCHPLHPGGYDPVK